MKTIARSLSIVAVAALAVVTLFVVMKRPAQITRQPNVAALESEIRGLQSKVIALENRIEDLQKAAAQNPRPQPFVVQFTNPVPRVQNGIIAPGLSEKFADPNHPPKIWGEGECNGWKYYIIPLNGTEASSAAQPIGLASVAGVGPNR